MRVTGLQYQGKVEGGAPPRAVSAATGIGQARAIFGDLTTLERMPFKAIEIFLSPISGNRKPSILVTKRPNKNRPIPNVDYLIRSSQSGPDQKFSLDEYSEQLLLHGEEGNFFERSYRIHRRASRLPRGLRYIRACRHSLLLFGHIKIVVLRKFVRVCIKPALTNSYSMTDHYFKYNTQLGTSLGPTNFVPRIPSHIVPNSPGPSLDFVSAKYENV